MTRSSSSLTAITSSRLPVSIPHAFLTETVINITCMAELQVSLAMFRLVAVLEGEETPIAERMILRDEALNRAMRRDGIVPEPAERILKGLELAVGRGTILRFLATQPSHQAYWYYLDTTVNRATVASMERGALPPPAIIWEGKTAPAISLDPPNAYRLYEQNIGPLTPLIADQITRAVTDYPGDWIEDAITEAVSYNRRSWRYILRILENWQASGRQEQEHYSGNA
ncbi:MAG TPA: DnaD domain protein [Thermomicrobiales bacterium]|nr:DnaD domain protein [Thermomicrobiales bacterium]